MTDPAVECAVREEARCVRLAAECVALLARLVLCGSLGARSVAVGSHLLAHALIVDVQLKLCCVEALQCALFVYGPCVPYPNRAAIVC